MELKSKDFRKNFKTLIPYILVVFLAVVLLALFIFSMDYIEYKSKYKYTRTAIEYTELDFVKEDKVAVIETSGNINAGEPKDITVSLYHGKCFTYSRNRTFKIKPKHIESPDRFLSTLPIAACVEYISDGVYMVVFDAQNGHYDAAFKNIIRIMGVTKDELNKDKGVQ